MSTYYKTLKVRIRDKHAKLLSKMAFEVNQVWNNANAITAEYSYVPIPEFGLSQYTMAVVWEGSR